MWAPYVSQAQRRQKAAKEAARLAKDGQPCTPVSIAGRTIASTFWGRAWCDNLEAYADFSNRMPRGRTYVRNGSVIDLKVAEGKVTALVSGSSVYKVEVTVKPVERKQWSAMVDKCAGRVGSLVELLKGKLSGSVMEVLCARPHGLFPSPQELKFSCSCPDWASMCKHVAAALYGVGHRLDHEPELLFLLRGVDKMELLAGAARTGELARKPAAGRTLDDAAVADVFGIELEEDKPTSSRSRRAGKPAARPAEKKKPAKKAAARKPVKKATVRKPAKKAAVRKPVKKAVKRPAAKSRRGAGA
jgi:uncharacterized Zn finger protein